MADDWTDDENNAIVADYFAMLADDIARRPYNKAQHNRKLQNVIERPRGSIEFKHRNISAVLKGLGRDWIAGYKPAFNIQTSLIDAVVRWLNRHPDWLAPMSRRSPPGEPPSAREEEMLWIGPPPTLSNVPPPHELEQMTAIARKFDVAERDARNRALGRAGEERCWNMNAPASSLPDALTSPLRSAGCPSWMATARDSTFRASRLTAAAVSSR